MGMVPVEELKPGDMIDLAGDPYADVDDEDDGRHTALEFSYAVVEGIEEETADCTVVYTDIASQGFPRGHLVDRVEG